LSKVAQGGLNPIFFSMFARKLHASAIGDGANSSSRSQRRRSIRNPTAKVVKVTLSGRAPRH
jgi:hypothetical protein